MTSYPPTFIQEHGSLALRRLVVGSVHLLRLFDGRDRGDVVHIPNMILGIHQCTDFPALPNAMMNKCTKY